MLIALIVSLALLVIALITIFVIQEDNRIQQDFIEYQGAEMDRMRCHLAPTYWMTYHKENEQ